MNNLDMKTQASQESNNISSWNRLPIERANSEIGTLNLQDGIDCPICLNRGYSLYESEGYMTQKDCTCMVARRSSKNAKKSGLGNLLKHNLESYVVQKPFQKKAKETALEYLQEERKEWFVMLGQSGAGKTHICSAIANELLKRGKEVSYISWQDFMSEIKKQIAKDDERYFVEIRDVEVLYIDDFLKSKPTTFELDIAYRILNSRYAKKLVTLISSERFMTEKNRNGLDGLVNVDEAITGRIKELAKNYVIEITNDDAKNYRMEK
jgi:DNA replication protein